LIHGGIVLAGEYSFIVPIFYSSKSRSHVAWFYMAHNIGGRYSEGETTDSPIMNFFDPLTFAFSQLPFNLPCKRLHALMTNDDATILIAIGTPYSPPSRHRRQRRAQQSSVATTTTTDLEKIKDDSITPATQLVNETKMESESKDHQHDYDEVDNDGVATSKDDEKPVPIAPLIYMLKMYTKHPLHQQPAATTTSSLSSSTTNILITDDYVVPTWQIVGQLPSMVTSPFTQTSLDSNLTAVLLSL
jgi:hypothetical protein